VGRRREFERAQVPARDVGRGVAGAGSERVNAVGQGRTCRQAFQAQGQCFRAVNVGGVGFDGRQQNG
nr:hypothetical protein [Tanacetum cinerariifolium]